MAADYSPTLPETTRFFRFIQNKLHFAVTGKTAAELIAERADSRRPNMGLTTWKSGSIQKADVTIAKKQADTHAESQYEQFAAQRRALLEAEGADANVRALEDAAKALPKPGKSSNKRK